MNQDQKAELYMVINASDSSKWERVVPFGGVSSIVSRWYFARNLYRFREIPHTSLSLSLSSIYSCNEFPSTVARNQGNFTSFLDMRLIL